VLASENVSRYSTFVRLYPPRAMFTSYPKRRKSKIRDSCARVTVFGNGPNRTRRYYQFHFAAFVMRSFSPSVGRLVYGNISVVKNGQNNRFVGDTVYTGTRTGTSRSLSNSFATRLFVHHLCYGTLASRLDAGFGDDRSLVFGVSNRHVE